MTLNGLLLIHKPGGMTSHDVVSRVRRLCRTRKVGHAGTLDPMATGVLPIAVNEGTKVLQFLLLADKAYRAEVTLGIETDSQDKEGQIVRQSSVEGLTCEAVTEAMTTLTGEISQVPPMYSAIKKDGVPLYKLARQGVEVEREARQVRVERFELLHCGLPDTPMLEVDVSCSKGTYIRTLCHDLGQALACGAHLTALERTRVGPFSLDRCLTLEALADALEQGEVPLLTPDEALAEYPAVELPKEAFERLNYGIAPSLEELSTEMPLNEGQTCRLRYNGSLKAMARVRKNQGGKQRGDFELLRVFNLL